MISKYSANKFCKDDISKIENYDKAMTDTTQTWDCHHRLEIHSDYTNSREELKMMNLYYNRPAEELIFLKHTEHMRLHYKDRKRSEETIRKISASKQYISDETRRKLSDSATGRKMSEAAKRRHAANRLLNHANIV